MKNATRSPLFPDNLRILFEEYFPAELSQIENDGVLADTRDLLSGRNDSELRLRELLSLAFAAYNYARNWHKPLHEMTRAELDEHRLKAQPQQPNTHDDALKAVAWAITAATSHKEATDPELADALDVFIKAGRDVTDMLVARQRPVDELFRYFQPDPREKTLASWRAWFGCVLCRWFVQNLKRPNCELAAKLSTSFFRACCSGDVNPELLSRNYIRSS